MGLDKDVEEQIHDFYLVFVFEAQFGHFDAFVDLLRLREEQSCDEGLDEVEGDGVRGLEGRVKEIKANQNVLFVGPELP